MQVFGVPHLDEALSVPSAKGPILLHNQPGTEAEPFLWQAARQALRAGKDVVYLTTDRPPKRIRDRLGDHANLHILDAFSSLHGILDPDVQSVQHPENPSDLAAHLEQMANAHDGAMLIVDSLSGIAMRGGADKLDAAAPRLFAAMGKFHCTIALHTDFSEATELSSTLGLFPNAVYLQGVQDRIITNHYFRVERIGGTSTPNANPVLYRADEQSVRVYVPKIVVTGPANAGKTTFVHAVSDHAVSAERKGATVAMDKGTIEREGLRVEVFGTPGQERFDPILKPIMNQAVGVILVLDATKPEEFPRGLEMLEMAWRKGLNAIVVANKQDQAGALAPEAVQAAMDLPEGVQVLPCSALDDAAARQIIDILIAKILHPEVQV